MLIWNCFESRGGVRGGVNIKRRKRSKNDIVEDILRVAVNGAKKTDIVHEANLNSSLAQEYLQTLIEKELIRHEKGLFITTDKGRIFREMAKEIKLWTNSQPFILKIDIDFLVFLLISFLGLLRWCHWSQHFPDRL